MQESDNRQKELIKLKKQFELLQRQMSRQNDAALALSHDRPVVVSTPLPVVVQNKKPSPTYFNHTGVAAAINYAQMPRNITSSVNINSIDRTLRAFVSDRTSSAFASAVRSPSPDIGDDADVALPTTEQNCQWSSFDVIGWSAFLIFCSLVLR